MADFTLYNYFRSSASFRVRIALNLKKIAYDYKAVHLVKDGGAQHSDSYGAINPSKQVPTLLHGDKAIGQSVAIFEYLDAIQPLNPLFPMDPLERALVMQICEIINSGTQPMFNLTVLKHLETEFGFDQAKKDDWGAHWCHVGYQALERILAKTAGKYSFGDKVTAADCFLVPQSFSAKRFHVGTEKYPVVDRIVKTCLELPEFVSASPEKQPDWQA